MKIAVLGTGMVGRTLADALARLGHEVAMGARSRDNEVAISWAAESGERASHGTFREAAAEAELVFNCTAGAASLDALSAAGAENLAGKVLVDVANPLDFSQGMPPSLTVSVTDSLGEQLQRAFPETKVVKALNTVNHLVMVDPSRPGGNSDVFVCGDDDDAKDQVRELLHGFGWPNEWVVDLGDISAARGTEGYLLLWLRLMSALGTADFNIKVVR